MPEDRLALTLVYEERIHKFSRSYRSSLCHHKFQQAMEFAENAEANLFHKI